MIGRHPLPRLWLMTDERQGDGLWKALARLPRCSGIVFRHYGLAPAEREALFRRVRRVARKRGHLILLAGQPGQARAWQADGWHGRGHRRPSPGLIRSAPAHDLREVNAARRAGADFVFLSPVFATRSHPGAKSLGRLRFALLARTTRLPVIALGGMNPRRAQTLAGAYGWAGIDAWSG